LPHLAHWILLLRASRPCPHSPTASLDPPEASAARRFQDLEMVSLAIPALSMNGTCESCAACLSKLTTKNGRLCALRHAPCQGFLLEHQPSCAVRRCGDTYTRQGLSDKLDDVDALVAAYGHQMHVLYAELDKK